MVRVQAVGAAARHAWLVLQGAGGAGVDARPTGHARALGEGGARVGNDPCRSAPAGDLPDELALHVVADAHAPPARDAARQVDVDERVGVVDERGIARPDGLAGEPVARREAGGTARRGSPPPGRAGTRSPTCAGVCAAAPRSPGCGCGRPSRRGPAWCRPRPGARGRRRRRRRGGRRRWAPGVGRRTVWERRCLPRWPPRGP